MPNSHRHLHRRVDFKVEKFLDDVKNTNLHQNDERDPDAVIRTVYKTMAPTFEGEVAGYTTVKDADSKPTSVSTKAANQSSTTQAAKKKDDTTTSTKPKATSSDNTSDKSRSTPKTTSTSNTSSVPTVIQVTLDTASLDPVLATASEEVTLPTTLARPTEAVTSPALASASTTSAAKSTDGSSAGAKAGIAFGVLGGLFLVGFLVFFIFNRRKRRAEHERLAKDDEKLNGPIGGAVGGAVVGGSGAVVDTMSVKTDPKAPRISLRPVTQFLPNWNMDKRASKGAGIALSAPGAASGSPSTSRAPGGSAWDRPTTSQSIDPANPFGAQAERVPSPIQEESVRSNSSPASPTPSNDPLTANGSPIAGTAIGAAAGAGAVAAMTRKTSMRQGGPKNLDLTLPSPPLGPVPASPAGTEFSVSSMNPGAAAAPSAGAAAIAAAGGPANSAVHRVQLDFKPTLEDELELKAGDLVRLLHEYDDGWALCIRIDRTHQGVVPRTCLSTRPVKPRSAQNSPPNGPQNGPRSGPPVKPAGPPRGPNFPQGQRPTTPNGGRSASPASRPMTPNGGRSQSPMGRPMSPAGRPGMRPKSPGSRSQSPGPRQGPQGGRSQSPSGMSRRPSPPGPSPMNPTQAPSQSSPTGSSTGPPTGPVGRKPVPGQAY